MNSRRARFIVTQLAWAIAREESAEPTRARAEKIEQALMECLKKTPPYGEESPLAYGADTIPEEIVSLVTEKVVCGWRASLASNMAGATEEERKARLDDQAAALSVELELRQRLGQTLKNRSDLDRIRVGGLEGLQRYLAAEVSKVIRLQCQPFDRNRTRPPLKPIGEIR